MKRAEIELQLHIGVPVNLKAGVAAASTPPRSNDSSKLVEPSQELAR